MKKLTKPTSQTTEVLYELIIRFSIDVRSMILSCGVLSLTKQISILRDYVEIESEKIETTNKFERKVNYTRYKLPNKKSDIVVYNKLLNK